MKFLALKSVPSGGVGHHFAEGSAQSRGEKIG